MRLSPCASLVLALVVLAPRAHADTPPAAPTPTTRPTTAAPPTPAQVDEARGHFNRGVKFYKDADYRSALVEFQEAYRVAPNARVLFNIGQTYEELQDFAGAVKAFRDYLRESGTALTKTRRAEVEKDLHRLESHVAVVDVSVSEAGADVIAEGDRRIELGKSPLGAAVLLNGGKWTISATKPGFERAEERLTAAGGDVKKLTLTLAPTAEAAPPVAPAPVALVAPPPARRSLTPTWIGVAVTGGLAVGAGVAGALTLGAKSDYDREVGRFPGDADAISKARTHARTLALVTDVLGGAAIVSAVVTVVLYLGARETTPDPHRLPPGSTGSAAEPRPSITPLFGPQGLGATGTF